MRDPCRETGRPAAAPPIARGLPPAPGRPSARIPLTPGGSPRRRCGESDPEDGAERRTRTSQRQREKKSDKIKSSRRPARRGAGAVVAAFTATLAGGALAFEFDTGNPDLSIRWDNTFALQPRRARRRRATTRSATRRSPTRAPTASTQGDAVANRVDLLSELDVVYKKRYGVRVSAAGWYDAAYDGDSPATRTRRSCNIPSYVGNRSTPTTPSASITARRASCSTRSCSATSTSAPCRRRSRRAATRCTGASRCSSAATSTASPTRRTRSTCRRASRRRAPKPRSCSGRWTRCRARPRSPTPCRSRRSTSAQWEPFRYPEGGTYLGPVDFVFNGPERQFLPQPGARVRHARQCRSSPARAASGASRARWSPEWLDGTLGLLLPQLRRQAAADPR